jgi:DNA-directed RNA polymerase specialized sigma24 family protein
LTGKEGLPVDAQAEAEFTEYMDHRWMRLVRLGYAVTGDRVLAEDIAQTALSRVYASWPKVRRASNPDAYVRAIVLNLCRDMRRRNRVAEVLTDAVPEPPSGRAGPDHRGAAGRSADDRGSGAGGKQNVQGGSVRRDLHGFPAAGLDDACS